MTYMLDGAAVHRGRHQPGQDFQGADRVPLPME
jgi:hypothetical protein